jgi:hypothetical protein
MGITTKAVSCRFMALVDRQSTLYAGFLSTQDVSRVYDCNYNLISGINGPWKLI